MSLTRSFATHRSQHDVQSWLSALVSTRHVLAAYLGDRRSVLPSGAADLCDGEARGHRPGVGLPCPGTEGLEAARRVPTDCRRRFPPVSAKHCDNHLQLCGDPAAAKRLDTIRALYEPHALALSDYLEDAVAGLGDGSEGERSMERPDKAANRCGVGPEGTGRFRCFVSR